MGNRKWLIVVVAALMLTSGCAKVETQIETPGQESVSNVVNALPKESAEYYAPTLEELLNARLEVPGAGAPFGYAQETAHVPFSDGVYKMSKLDFVANMAHASAATWLGQDAVRIVFLTYMNGTRAFSSSHLVAYNSDKELVAFADLSTLIPEVGSGWAPGVNLLPDGKIGLYWNGLCSNAYPGAGLECLQPDRPGWVALALLTGHAPGAATDKAKLAGFTAVDQGRGYPAWADQRAAKRPEGPQALAPKVVATQAGAEQGIVKGAELDPSQSALKELPASTDIVQAVFTLLDALEKADESFVWALTLPAARRALEAPPLGQKTESVNPAPQTIRELLAAVGKQNLIVNWCAAGGDLPTIIPQINSNATYCLLVSHSLHSTAGGINLLVQLPAKEQGIVAQDIVPLEPHTAARLSTGNMTNLASAQTAQPLVRTYSGQYAHIFNGSLEVPTDCLAGSTQVDVRHGFGRSGQSFVYMRSPVVPFPAAGPDAVVAPLECHYQGQDLFHERIAVYNGSGRLLGQLALRETPDGDDGEAGIIERMEVVDPSGKLSAQGDRLRVQWKNHLDGGDVSCHLCFDGTGQVELQWKGGGFEVVGY